MELIPLIYMKKRKIHLKKTGPPISQEEFLQKLNGESRIYILDLDGIEKDKPNLCTFQRLSPTLELWLDTGPRDIGDVVDAFMAGALEITIRKNLCKNLKVPNIREISENKIYINISYDNLNFSIDDLDFNDSDGIVNLYNKDKIEQDFKSKDYFNQIKIKNKTYSYESDPVNIEYWKRQKVEGLLVDIDKLEEFKKHGF